MFLGSGVCTLGKNYVLPNLQCSWNFTYSNHVYSLPSPPHPPPFSSPYALPVEAV